MNQQTTLDFVNRIWDDSITPTLEKYIRIPNKSPAYDVHWEKNGHMEQAVQLIQDWCLAQQVQGVKLTVHRAPQRTPLLLLEIAGQIDSTVILYGHLDKQPEMTGWAPDLGPWQPVIKQGRLYGRGGADDGYSTFAALTAIKSLQEQKIPHARCVILIEASEESGSNDLPYYIDQLEQQIGKPDLVICLDSGCGNYEQLWCTTSLRGLVSGRLKVEILTEGVHSGAASGIVPSSFRIIRELLNRIEDPTTGHILLPELHVEIPPERIEEAKNVAAVLGPNAWQAFPFTSNAKPVESSMTELILNRTWRPALSVTGAGGIPILENAGNVLRPFTTLMLSMRIPPLCDPQRANAALKKCLEANPPYNANVTFTPCDNTGGWNAPKVASWLKDSLDKASQLFYQKPALYWGEGGSIPFMGMLGKKFPQAQFAITGVLGPHSNAHGPNEFLDLAYAKRLTCSVAKILADHYVAMSR